jgi:transposase
MVSGDTLLAHIRAAAAHPLPTPRALSVDDFALRRGRTYGSILVDLESHRVVDLLPDRSGQTFAAWLTAHPGAEIISRDRGGEYAEAARRAAPAAVQVADRFHLLRNLRDVVLRIFKRHAKRIAQVALPAAEPESLIRLRPDRAASRERTRREMEDRFNAIQRLATQGMSRSAIARALGLHRHTVQKYYPLTTAPERRHTTRTTSALTPYEGYVLERWWEGCHNAKQLWREIAARGYQGAYRGVALLVRHLRDRQRAGQSLPRALTGLTPAGATGIAVMRSEKRSAHERHALLQVGDLHIELQATLALFASFAALLREQDEGEPSAQLDHWMANAASSGIAEIRAFATKLRQDRAAVLAALTLPHSHGQTEGQINKLKLVKRAMYGRARFDLLRQRILHAA